MQEQGIDAIKSIFSTGLDTLNHLLDAAVRHFGDEAESIMARRLAPDMLPFAAQISIACNQPHNFVLWCEGKGREKSGPEPQSIAEARAMIDATKAELGAAVAADARLGEARRFYLSGDQYAEWSGLGYVNEFLLPSFYFHLVIAYAILRAAGVPLGKSDYLRHVMPQVRRG